MKLAGARLDRIIFGALPIELDPRAARLHLELFDRFDRNTKSNRATFTLLNWIGDWNSFYEHIFLKAMGSINLYQTISLSDTGQQVDECAGISWALTDSRSSYSRSHCEWQIRIQLVSDRRSQSRIGSVQL